MSPDVWEILGEHTLHSIRVYLPAGALFGLTLTVGAYLLAQATQRKLGGSPFANPLLIAIAILAVSLRMTGMSYADYFSGAQFIHFLLGPATVALAVPLVESWEHVKRSKKPLAVALLAGSLVSAVSGFVLVRLCGGSHQVAVSMMPKAVTTPIAIAVSQHTGGDSSLTVVFAVLGGVLVAAVIEIVFHQARVKDWRAYGFAAGTAGSGIGTARVMEMHSLAGAFAGLAIGVNGVVTSLLVPVLAQLLHNW
jgi:putative effector of murein hydrolase